MPPTLSPPSIGASELGARLADQTYLRHRLSPRLQDGGYLYLSDLLEVTMRFAAQAEGDLFDYGCGGTPYRGLFARCAKYIGADVTPGPTVDRLLPAEGLTRELADTYDVVLSSQVLEHIRNPGEYLSECFRILKPGGRLLVTTHGMFEEHGCPFDFHRWTVRGLDFAVADAGFQVVQSVKLTTGIRGSIQLMHQFVNHFRCPERPFLDWVFTLMRKLYAHLAVPALNWFAKTFHEQGVVPGDHASPLYLGVAVIAQKPKSTMPAGRPAH